MCKTLLTLAVMTLVVMLQGCGTEPSNRKKTIASKGLPYELLIIVDEPVWNSSLRDSINAVFEGAVPGLGQPEPLFRTMRLYPRHYSQRYSTMRNIVEIRVDSTEVEPRVSVAHDAQAKPQLYVRITAPTPQALAVLLREQGGQVADLFVESELAYAAAMLRGKHSTRVDKAMETTLGRGVCVPVELERLKQGEDFVWAATNTADRDLNFMAYAIPLQADTAMQGSTWIQLRDSALQRNVPGDKPGRWMTTARVDGVPLVQTRSLRLAHGRQVYEMRGLWEMHRGTMGGPFVSLAYPDSAAGRMLVVEGFVFAPNANKRDMIRRLEAALRTLR